MNFTTICILLADWTHDCSYKVTNVTKDATRCKSVEIANTKTFISVGCKENIANFCITVD